MLVEHFSSHTQTHTALTFLPASYFPKTASTLRVLFPLSFILALLLLGFLFYTRTDHLPDMASVSTEFKTLGQNLQSLRKIKGHWDGGDSNPRVDSFNGEKHQALKVKKQTRPSTEQNSLQNRKEKRKN